MDKNLFKKLEKLKKEYTFDKDKRVVTETEKNIRKAIVIEEASKLDGVKEFIELMRERIKDITLLLAWDKELNEDLFGERRRSLFVERGVYQNLLSFFTDVKQTIKSAEKMVEENLKD